MGYPAIQTPLGNPDYPGASSIFSIYADAHGRVWGSTVLPIWIFNLYSPDLVPLLNPFGVERGVEGVGDRGEVYTWIERVPGEVWAGIYGGKNRIARFAPSRSGHDIEGVHRLWRPKGAATDGTTIWWVGNNIDGQGDPILGTVVASAANGSAVVYTDVVDQVLMCADYHGGVLYACGSGEGLAGAELVPTFYAIDPATMDVLWECPLAGTRPLSMLRVSETEYAVICHLTSDTTGRLVLVDAGTESRAWHQDLSPLTILGRARNCLRQVGDEIWTLCDAGIYTVDLETRSLSVRHASASPDAISAFAVAGDTTLLARGRNLFAA